ncbi:MAG: Fe-S protein assembly co-chaperone HscB [Myxococcales bacterium]|nr:MAG: Fe-S protein assembly co-chaperone HscB [Myxococcales bacterium]
MAVDPFALLGVEPRFDLDLEALEQRYREVSRQVHPDRFARAGAAERRQALGRAVDVNAAWRTLRDPLGRASAVLARLGVAVDERQPASQAMLMDFLELREELADARHDEAAVRRLEATVREREAAASARLAAALDRLVGGHDRAALAAPALDALGELRYVRRFLDEVRAIDEERESQ